MGLSEKNGNLLSEKAIKKKKTHGLNEAIILGIGIAHFQTHPHHNLQARNLRLQQMVVLFAMIDVTKTI